MYASSRMPLRKHGCCTLPAVDMMRSLGWMGMERTQISPIGEVVVSICLGLIDEVGDFGLVARTVCRRGIQSGRNFLILLFSEYVLRTFFKKNYGLMFQLPIATFLGDVLAFSRGRNEMSSGRFGLLRTSSWKYEFVPRIYLLLRTPHHLVYDNILLSYVGNSMLGNNPANLL